MGVAGPARVDFLPSPVSGHEMTGDGFVERKDFQVRCRSWRVAGIEQRSTAAAPAREAIRPPLAGKPLATARGRR
jgi:hypothetical protein